MASQRPKSQSFKRKKRKPEGPTKPRSRHSIKKKGKGSRGSRNPNLVPLGNNKLAAENSKEMKGKKGSGEEGKETTLLVSAAPPAQQLGFFLDRFQSAKGFKLSHLELEAYKDTCVVELSQRMDQDVDNFSKHMKATFGGSWREVLSDGKLSEGRVDAGSPSLLVISTSALRALELLRGLRSFTKECRPAKLFAKHMKVEEQVDLLKVRVNIACGTPSRIKKLIDIEALSLSRLAVIVLDIHRDAKGYSLLTLPQVSTEFWDLYKTHFDEKILRGDMRICFYGPIPAGDIKSGVMNKQ